MRTAYDELIERTSIEEDYGVDINKKIFKKMNEHLDNLLKQFNIMKT